MSDDNLDIQRQKDLEYIRNFRMIDDDFMKHIFTDKECVQLLLRIIIGIPDLEGKYVKTEYTVHNLNGRGVRFDVFATDSTGTDYNVEIQRSDKGAGTKRARYNSSMLDVNITNPGDRHEKLPETYVIFITENDVLARKFPIYHIERVILETGELFDDKAHIIYVNAEVQDDTPLGRLMQDFMQTKAENINYSVLADRVRYFKETDKGVNSMCRAMEEMRAEAAREAAAKAAKEAAARAAARAADTARKTEADLRQAGATEDLIQLAIRNIMEPYANQNA